MCGEVGDAEVALVVVGGVASWLGVILYEHWQPGAPYRP
jgi:hypothetical protein